MARGGISERLHITVVFSREVRPARSDQPANPAMDQGLLWNWQELQSNKAGNFYNTVWPVRISRLHWRGQPSHTYAHTHVITHWPVLHFGNNYNCPDNSGIRPASSVRRRASVNTKASGDSRPCSYQRFQRTYFLLVQGRKYCRILWRRRQYVPSKWRRYTSPPTANIASSQFTLVLQAVAVYISYRTCHTLQPVTDITRSTVRLSPAIQQPTALTIKTN
jgi:hypothetical protein